MLVKVYTTPGFPHLKSSIFLNGISNTYSLKILPPGKKTRLTSKKWLTEEKWFHYFFATPFPLTLHVCVCRQEKLSQHNFKIVANGRT